MRKLMGFLITLSVMLCVASGCSLFHTHEVVNTPYVNPTCTQPGYTNGSYCTTCNEVFIVRTELPALGHDVKVDEAVPATGFQRGLTEGSRCQFCDAVLVPQQTIDIVPPAEVDFSTGTITTEPTVIKTNYIELHIPANIYIPDNMTENMDAVMAIMEEVSGMSFSGRLSNREDLIVVQVQPGEDAHAEIDEPGGCSDYGVHIAPADLIDYYDLLRVYSDALNYNHSRWFRSWFSNGGFSTYTTYKTLSCVEERCPELLALTETTYCAFSNHRLSNYDALYEYPVEYWLENDFAFASNSNASIGFRFMWYLDDVYGDYTRWITEYEKINPSPYYTHVLSVEQEIRAFKYAYGDDVFDGFYPWMKEHQEIFDGDAPIDVDMTSVEMIRPFPTCIFGSTIWYLDLDGKLKYKDLWVDIETGKQYLKEYKGLNTDGITLYLQNNTPVELYDPEGRLVRTVTPVSADHSWIINLDGIGFVKFVGEGSLVYFNLDGYERYRE